ncbi:MAG: class I SAM-dependent methyltransferase [Planctomycetota bacterium]
MEPPGRERAHELSRASNACGDAVGWFERLYVEAERGTARVPWDDGAPWPALVAWVARRADEVAGRRTLVVGAGYGYDAVLLARAGARVTAFDVAPRALERARSLHPEHAASIGWEVADLLDPPVAWEGAFDLVVEVNTLQVLPSTPRARALARLPRLLAPGGLLVIGCRLREPEQEPGSMPWPLTAAELDTLDAPAAGGATLEPVEASDFLDQEQPPVRRALRVWRRGAARADRAGPADPA